MNDFAKIFGQMMEQSQKMAEAFNPSLASFKPQGFEALFPTMSREQMDMLWGGTFNKDGLDTKTRLLVVLAGLTVQGASLETPYKLTVRHALEAGATEQEIAEVIYQMSMLGGLPAMSKALELAKEVFSERSDTKEGNA